MDFSLDARDLSPVIAVLENCDGNNDPVIMALDSISNFETRMERSRENYLRAARMDCDPILVEIPSTYDRVSDAYRRAFGIGMCHIIHARCKRQKTMREAYRNPPPDKAAFRDIKQMVGHASTLIHPERWMTIQYELGYTAFDVFKTDDAERWLTLFRNNIDDAMSITSSSDLQSEQHWSNLRKDAVEKLNKLPWMRTIFPPNFGYI